MAGLARPRPPEAEPGPGVPAAGVAAPKPWPAPSSLPGLQASPGPPSTCTSRPPGPCPHRLAPWPWPLLVPPPGGSGSINSSLLGESLCPPPRGRASPLRGPALPPAALTAPANGLSRPRPFAQWRPPYTPRCSLTRLESLSAAPCPPSPARPGLSGPLQGQLPATCWAVPGPPSVHKLARKNPGFFGSAPLECLLSTPSQALCPQQRTEQKLMPPPRSHPEARDGATGEAAARRKPAALVM